MANFVIFTKHLPPAKLSQRRFAFFSQTRAKITRVSKLVRSLCFYFLHTTKSVLGFTPELAVCKFFARLILETPFIVLQYYKPSLFLFYNYKKKDHVFIINYNFRGGG
jgi:hypothetical protein